MLHAGNAGAAPNSYAMKLHREHQDRLARMDHRPVAPVQAEPVAIVSPAKVAVYPAFVFVEDVDAKPTASLISVGPTRIREIQDLICALLGARRADMTSARRTRAMVMARQIAMYLCKRHTPNSLPDIGRRFGGRDHTTVLHAVARVERMMGTETGTSVSRQWSAEDCDFIRAAVSRAETEIATWPEVRTRARYPARSRA